MSEIIIDAEVYSEKDVTKVGTHEYVNHPSTLPILWATRDPEWTRGIVFEEASIWKVFKMMKDANRIKWTRNEPLVIYHWSPFDRELVMAYEGLNEDDWSRYGDEETFTVLGPDNTIWCDLSEISAYYGGPSKLEDAAPWWGTGIQKDKGGKALINRFCKPNDGRRIMPDEDPVRWEQFRSYAIQDVDAVAPMIHRFEQIDDEGESRSMHWSYMCMIERMNRRGVMVDRAAAVTTTELLDQKAQEANATCMKTYGFKPSQVKEVREFLGTEDCRKETLEEYIDTMQGDPDQLALAEMRLLTSGAAVKKINALLHRSALDGRIRDSFKYAGAWTRRLTSSGAQLQNMVRHASDEMFFALLDETPEQLRDDIFSLARENIRGYLMAAPGHMFVAADYNAIEARVAAWIANEEWLIEAFANGEDVYLKMASEIYREAVTEKGDPRRHFGKVVELGSQYQLGWKGLINQCEPQGIELTERASKRAINTYRDTHPAIVRMWRDCESAWERLINASPGTVIEVGLHLPVPIKFVQTEMAIKVERPSGFGQYYWLPGYGKGEWPDGTPKYTLTFTGRDPRSGRMIRRDTYGGDIFQGIVQGIAADIMHDGMMNAEANGFDPVMTVHDEIVTEIEDDGEDYVDDLCEIICDLPAWADGLPIKAEGWQGRRFTK